ncbi:hypothetical protein GY21_12510 [Cryobacterium roopkundense]|uniref:Purine catabolism regulator n=1 Tax=Cryobacterium roopkundense TaxID=1001240 RepID=A0A099J5Z1_9MICO|nr:PucR family transcriptional regulator [Cryobacterium roopkundense]KGJ72868.1 hypothetical protein GY21_12510 [Cryobacterium roopkundense]MBB5643138.1 purine catabolism regulator [Cryobacterium roopkundense]
MISLAQLCNKLGQDLRSADGSGVASRSVTGVHISELDDPTPYLQGGELLLTTGIPVTGGTERINQYVQRLVEHGVDMLGLGLGAGTDEVPADLRASCRTLGVQLLIVPQGTPFMAVSRAYWDLVNQGRQADFSAAMRLQTSLAQAVGRPESAASVVKVLAEALGGWAAYLPADGGAETIWPAKETHVLPQLREETKRLNLQGMHASATFPLDGRDVIEYSIVADKRTAGFLAVRAGRSFRPADRQLMLTGCMLLSVAAQQQWERMRSRATRGAAVAALVLGGHVDAARIAAAELGCEQPAEQVRLLAVRGDRADQLSTAELSEVVAAMATGEGVAELRRGIRASDLRCVVDGLSYVIVREWSGDSLLREATSTSTSTSTSTPRGDEVFSAALSGPLMLAQVHASVREVGAACARAAGGRLVTVEGARDSRAQAWVEALRSYSRADLVETVRAYLRNRGQWEVTARELGLHRNSLRHRIGIASRLIDVNLDDPDVSAHLWLALRA